MIKPIVKNGREFKMNGGHIPAVHAWTGSGLIGLFLLFYLHCSPVFDTRDDQPFDNYI